MAKIKQSLVDPNRMFWLDGLEYQKGNWGVYYRNVVVNPDNTVDESVLLVGIRELNSHENILVTPILVKDWLDGTDTPYTDFNNLLLDLSTFLGFNGDGASSQNLILVVNNYNDLPDPTTVGGRFYYAEHSVGVKYIGALFGGNYHNSGIYYSNGSVWETIETPFQATQMEVNTGTVTDRFLTPSTFTNADKWNTKENLIAAGTALQYWRGDKTFQTLDKNAVGLGNVDNTSDASKNVLTATKWFTPRTVSITGDINYTSGGLDGSSNVTGTGTLATVNGDVGTFNNVTVNAKGLVTAASNVAYLTSYTETDPVVRAIVGIVKSDGNTISAAIAGDFPTLNQNTTGSAAKLTTGRTIAITGDISYTSPSFDGTGNVTAAGTLATVNPNVGTFNNVTVNGKGLVTAASNVSYLTSYTETDPVVRAIVGIVKSNGTTISAATSGTDYSQGTSALGTGIVKTTTGTGALSVAVAGDFPTLNQSTTGSAATLTTGRTIAITGDISYTSPSFNGSANVTAAGTLATVNSNVGTFGSASTVNTLTVNGKGLVTAISNQNIQIAESQVTNLTTDLAKRIIPIDSSGAAVSNVYEYNGVVAKGAGSGLLDINISALGFTSIMSVQLTGERTSTAIGSLPFVCLTATPTTSNVSVAVAESKNTGVLIGGIIEGLEFVTAACNIHITIRGIK